MEARGDTYARSYGGRVDKLQLKFAVAPKKTATTSWMSAKWLAFSRIG